jgi:hypothetical protein
MILENLKTSLKNKYLKRSLKDPILKAFMYVFKHYSTSFDLDSVTQEVEQLFTWLKGSQPKSK